MCLSRPSVHCHFCARSSSVRAQMHALHRTLHARRGCRHRPPHRPPPCSAHTRPAACYQAYRHVCRHHCIRSTATPCHACTSRRSTPRVQPSLPLCCVPGRCLDEWYMLTARSRGSRSNHHLLSRRIVRGVSACLLQLALSKIQMLASRCGWLSLTSPLPSDHSMSYDWLEPTENSTTAMHISFVTTIGPSFGRRASVSVVNVQPYCQPLVLVKVQSRLHCPLGIALS